MNITIDRVGSFIPETALSMDELRNLLGMTDAQLATYRRFLGYEKVVSAEGVSLLDMLVSAADPVLHGVDLSRIRYLIYAHTIQQAAPPGVNVTAQLRAALGLDHAVSFAISHQNCATGLYAVYLADLLLASDPGDGRALIVMGERAFCRETRVIPNMALLGEAAAAVLVSKGGSGDEVLSSQFHMYGKFYEGIKAAPELVRELNKKYTGALSDVIREAIHRAGIDIADVALILPHNVSRLSWMGVSRALGIPMSKIFLDNVPRLGHVFCADPFINLDAARRAGLLNVGDAVVLACMGIGATFGALVARIGEGGE